MISLEASGTIQGVATNATEVTYTITGEEFTTGTSVYKTLAQGQLAASAGVLYTAPAGSGSSALVSHILIVNNDNVAQAITLYIDGTTAANAIFNASIPANGNATFDRNGWKVYDSNGRLQVSEGLSFANGYGITGNTGLSPTPAVDLSYIESFITSDVPFTLASTIYNVTDVSLVAGTWDVSASGLVLNTNNTGNPAIDLWIGPTSASKTSAYAAFSAYIGEFGGVAADAITMALRKKIVLASPTTVYLSGIANATGITVKEATILESIGNVSGITAERVG